MSGGHFNDNEYVYYKVAQFADELELEIQCNSVDNGRGYCPNFSEATLKELKKWLPRLKQMADVMHHIDYLYSGDYGEDTFLERMSLLRELDPSAFAKVEAYGEEIGLLGISLDQIIDSHRTLRSKNRERQSGYQEGLEAGYNAGMNQARREVQEGTVFLEDLRNMTLQEVANFIGTYDE